ncbi:MAG TPA: hypothetical protein VMV18_05575 [bacterium]|nr:hypothetical protein [bacterium]
MSRQFWTETIAWATVSGTAVSNTASETIIFPDVTIPANYFQDGRLLNLRAQGEHSTTSTPTLIFRVRGGGVAGTLICLSPTFTTGSGVSHKLWEVDVLIQIRTNGSSGTLVAIGDVTVVGATVPASLMCAGGDNTPATASFDFTTAFALSLTAQWGSASSSNTLTGWIYALGALN